MRSWIFVALATVAAIGCGKPPEPPIPPGAERITGTERLGWSQEAGSVEELATFRYLVYVDNVARDADGLSCGATAGPAGFACTSRLPSMTPGLHELTLSAYIEVAGTRLESERSSPISVFLVGQTSTSAASPSEPATASRITTIDGVELGAEVVVDGLDEPTDLAFGSDGRIFVAERGGRVRVVRDGRIVPQPAFELSDVSTEEGHGLLALDVDPNYTLNKLVYLVYTTPRGFRLARLRGVGDTLGDRAILLDEVPASDSGTAATVRFGPDRRLYLGLDDGGDAGRAGDFGSYSGKILRLTAEATTPSDQPGASPVYVPSMRRPRSVAWGANGMPLWVLDSAGASGGLLHASSGARTVVSSYSLPEGTGATALAVYRGDLIPSFRENLFVAASADRSLLRLTIDPENPFKVAATEHLRHEWFDEIRALGIGPDGAMYICTSRTLVRLAPPRSGGL